MDSTTLLEEGLVSVLQHRPADCEVIVVIRGDYDDPYNLRDEDVRFVNAGEASDWLSLVNRGLAVAAGDVVHLLACGAEVQEAWADRALAHFEDAQVAAVAPLVLTAGDTERVLAAGVQVHRSGAGSARHMGQRLAAVPQTSQPTLGPSASAAFYRTEALSAVGDQLDAFVGPALADVDLALRLQTEGYHAVFEPTSQIVLPKETLPTEPAGRERACHQERLFWRHLSSNGRAAQLAMHFLAVLGESLWGIATLRVHQTLAGRCQGLCDALLGRVRYAKRVATSIESARSLRLEAAQRSKGKRLVETQRPLRRSA
ncbi:MAG: hypothetical protein JNM18_12870 [Planctomycetaceae bacterium]|nr:hypothetical protein [Planctomycetaceae bacterium]